MLLANEIAFGVHYLEGHINRFKFPDHTNHNNLKMVPSATLSNARQQE